ncbi:hypothetical protein THAOC_12667 [Thalassiosira oceanica]|uniref:Uncharacterized protein n=1 Tax=Thalassiosira oceanica TaxID=159749 RepID=K0SZD7_THAOC|nr:hypothetical protein THAOC_12667 [Thalassiosira oceanica]|eukprot:EJK66416.1 hypothetical protein THAOC_12667 [Thalassiosira oceanica]
MGKPALKQRRKSRERSIHLPPSLGRDRGSCDSIGTQLRVEREDKRVGQLIAETVYTTKEYQNKYIRTDKFKLLIGEMDQQIE